MPEPGIGFGEGQLFLSDGFAYPDGPLSDAAA
jgi:hypothetical protein